jgi:hypothetical protein
MSKEACEEFMFGERGVMHLLADGQYQPALEAIVTQGHLYPEIAKILLAKHISLAAHLGDIPQALRLMETALSNGIYFPSALFQQPPTLEPPGYAVLNGIPEFERLRELHQAHYRKAIDKAEPVLRCASPLTSTGEPPLLIAFHGNTSNIELEADVYDQATRIGWLLAQPQSAQSWTSWGYVWGDMEVTEQQVRSYWKIIHDQSVFDRKRIVTAGISKGGEIAIWSIMTGIVPACGFVVIAPGGPFIHDLEKLHTLIKPMTGSGLRGYLIVGDEDRWGLDGTKRLASILKAEGIQYELEICPGLGHEFPQDFAQKLERALFFVAQS